MAKVSIVLYALVGIALVSAAVILAVVSQASGLTGHLDRLDRRLFGLKAVSLRPVRVAEGAAVIAGILVATGVTLHLIGAFIYNRIADLTGGLAFRLARLTSHRTVNVTHPGRKGGGAAPSA